MLLESGLYESIVFDVDGTLIHSEPTIRAVAFEVMKTYITAEASRFFEQHVPAISSQCFGNSDDIFSIKVLDYLRGHSTLSSHIAALSEAQFLRTFAADRRALSLDYCKAGHITPMPGAVEFVLSAFEVYGPLAINTGSPEELSYPMLQSAFRDRFDLELVFPRHLRTFVSDLPKGHGKPSPDGYIRAARLLGHAPWKLMAIVDRGNDCMSALRAQYRHVVIVPEDGDTAPLLAPSGKHSLAAFLESHPITAHKEIVSRYQIVSSLVDLGFDAYRKAA